MSPTTFNLDQLVAIDGGIQSKIIMAGGDNLIGYKDHAGLDAVETANLLQPTAEVMTATTIAQSISSNMVEHMLTTVDLSFTNASGKNTVIVSNVQSYIEGIKITNYINKLVSKIESVLMPEVTHNGMVMIEAFVHADLLGDTTVSISVNNQSAEIVRFPTFADSLYSPVISNSVDRSGTSEDFRNIFDSAINRSGDTPALYS
jgi:hypothetical protein